jgi:hypothetical protein
MAAHEIQFSLVQPTGSPVLLARRLDQRCEDNFASDRRAHSVEMVNGRSVENYILKSLIDARQWAVRPRASHDSCAEHAPWTQSRRWRLIGRLDWPWNALRSSPRYQRDIVWPLGRCHQRALVEPPTLVTLSVVMA